jgi:hypothetical protein
MEQPHRAAPTGTEKCSVSSRESFTRPYRSQPQTAYGYRLSIMERYVARFVDESPRLGKVRRAHHSHPLARFRAKETSSSRVLGNLREELAVYRWDSRPGKLAGGKGIG